MTDALAPAYYAARTAGWRRDVWALLHPPYTAWHLSYVLIGASLAPSVSAGIGLVGAVGLGIAGIFVVGPWLIPFIALGVFFVFAYNLELLRGHVHGDFWFALSWGAFPVLTAYFAQTGRLSVAALAAAAAGYALSYAQRMLSTPARTLRRKSRSVSGEMILSDGSPVPLDRPTLLRPLERALSALSWGVVALSVGMVASRLL